MTTWPTFGRSALVSGVLVLCAVLGACGGAESAHDGDHGASATRTADSGEVFNDADVEFASQMVQHHAQAVQMVVLAQDRPLDPEVETLAARIRETQVPEIETMTDWLTAWGEEVPETSLDHANAGHDMGEMHAPEGMEDMPGMMSTEQMQTLADAADREFQAMWLEMMIDHHEGAVEMAAAEQADGASPEAVALARSIEAAQKDEIATMEALLG